MILVIFVYNNCHQNIFIFYSRQCCPKHGHRVRALVLVSLCERQTSRVQSSKYYTVPDWSCWAGANNYWRVNSVIITEVRLFTSTQASKCASGVTNCVVRFLAKIDRFFSFIRFPHRISHSPRVRTSQRWCTTSGLRGNQAFDRADFCGASSVKRPTRRKINPAGTSGPTAHLRSELNGVAMPYPFESRLFPTFMVLQGFCWLK